MSVNLVSSVSSLLLVWLTDRQADEGRTGQRGRGKEERSTEHQQDRWLCRRRFERGGLKRLASMRKHGRMYTTERVTPKLFKLCVLVGRICDSMYLPLIWITFCGLAQRSMPSMNPFVGGW